MEVAHYTPRVLRTLGFLILLSLYCTAGVAQEQTVSVSLSVPELREGQSTDLTLSYSATDNAKTSGLGLRLHFDSSALEMGATSDTLREGAQPFQIQSDSPDFDNNPNTDKFFLASWADFSGVGWPDIASQPVTLYVVPLTAKSDFAGEVLPFTGYSAPGYTLVAADIVIAKAEAPVITLLGEAEISLELGSTYTDAGATAADNIDGDITSNISAVSTVDVNIVGTYTVAYNVSDAAGNAASQISRTVNITPDVTIPVITLVGDTEVSLELGSTYTDAGATAVDNIDGDITASIAVVNLVDVNTVGTYTVTYNVSDAAGNLAVPVLRQVMVSGIIDIDRNGHYDALTDGLLLLRSIFGLDGDALVFGAVASNATVTSSQDILVEIDRLGMLLDIDGNGEIDALTDGLLILRYLFGLEGDILIAGVVAQNATRVTAAEIEAHLAGLTPTQ
jgi:hypothetical protein